MPTTRYRQGVLYSRAGDAYLRPGIKREQSIQHFFLTDTVSDRTSVLSLPGRGSAPEPGPVILCSRTERQQLPAGRI